MNPSLALDPATPVSLEPGRRPGAARPASNVQALRRPTARIEPAAAFVERRCMVESSAQSAIRSPLVLGFAGMVGGLMLSAALIVATALVLALLEVRWVNASHYSLAVVLAVFGAAAAALYWNLGETATRVLAWIEPAVERRAYYLHLSSLNAFENLRVVERAHRPAANAATLEAPPATTPSAPRPADAPAAQRRSPQSLRRAPMHQRFYSQHEAKARAPMNNWTWDQAEPA